jgi:hypothetical protein
MRDYTRIEAWRLADDLHDQTTRAFACLHGLIQAVEKEAGMARKIVATITSLVTIGVARLTAGGPVVL